MAVSDISRHRQEPNFWKKLLGQLSRYDLLLAAIPILFTLALLTYLFIPISLHVAVSGGAILSGLLVADALYFNPPTAISGQTDVTNSTESDDSVVGHSPEHGD